MRNMSRVPQVKEGERDRTCSMIGGDYKFIEEYPGASCCELDSALTLKLSILYVITPTKCSLNTN